jgi:MFS family permease
MLKQPSFYVIYLMMTLVAFGGLVVTAQLMAIAGFYKVDKVTVAFGMSAAILAIQLNRIVNGVTRPLWGWISDHIGRENAMFSAFLIEGLAIWAWLQTIQRPVMFVLLSSLVFFAWGEIFSLFPSITADLFGRKWATTNYGIVYTSKGTASIFAAPVASLRNAQNGFLGTSVLRHDCLRHHCRLYGSPLVETRGCPHYRRSGTTRACRDPGGRVSARIAAVRRRERLSRARDAKSNRGERVCLQALSRLLWRSVPGRLGREYTVFLLVMSSRPQERFCQLWHAVHSQRIGFCFAGFGAAALAAYFGGSFAVPFYISALLCGFAHILAPCSETVAQRQNWGGGPIG